MPTIDVPNRKTGNDVVSAGNRQDTDLPDRLLADLLDSVILAVRENRNDVRTRLREAIGL